MRILILLTIAALAAPGCDLPRNEQEARSAAKEAQSRLQNALNALMGNYVPPSPSPGPVDKKLQAKAELLHEMFEVVLLRDPYNPEEFNSYVNILGQGASLEGLYNGFVNSSQYLKAERESAPADPATLMIFSQVMPSFQKELSKTPVRPTDLGVAAPYDAKGYREVFSKASLFGLKRILGAEALKLVEAKRGPSNAPPAEAAKDREALAEWYSLWASEMAGWNVDFGIPLRNKADAVFHRKWALSLPADEASDRLLWEVLNRVHRLLNETEVAAMKKKGST